MRLWRYVGAVLNPRALGFELLVPYRNLRDRAPTLHEMRHWLLVTRPWNWQVCERRKLFGFDRRYRTTLEKYVRSGDLAAVYVTGQGFAAVIRITDIVLDATEHVGWKKGVRESTSTPELYPHRVAWTEVRRLDPPVKIDPRSNTLLDQLEYFTDKSRSWYSFVYPSIARIPPEDIQTILAW